MSEIPKADSLRINPFYETDSPNHPVILTTEHACLVAKTAANEEDKVHVAQGKIKVTMHWSPIRLAFEFDGEMVQEDPNVDKFNKLNFSHLGDVVRIEAKSFQATGCVIAEGVDGVDGVIDQNEITCGTDHNLQSITFHLANYTELHSTRSMLDREHGDFGAVRDYTEIMLMADGWRILLQPHRHIRELNWDAEKHVGNILSGIGKIIRDEGEEFSVRSARKIVDALDSFLSFVYLTRTPLMLCVGSNDTAQKSWQLWRTTNTQWVYGHNLKTWVPVGQGDQISNAFPGFLKKWNNPNWHDPLKRSIDWLINVDAQAEEGNVNGAIAFAQIPLEMLTWMAFVDETPIVNESEFDRLSFESKLQLLLSSCHVDFSVPSVLPLLHRISTTTKFTTGPKLIVKIRNTIIHPNKKNRETVRDWAKKLSNTEQAIYRETLKLFEHYIVLSVLHLIGYDGTYRSRLDASSLLDHSTPWEKSGGD